MARSGHVAYTDRFYELARLVPHLVTPEGKRIKRDRNVRDDNKRSRTGNVFATTANPAKRKYIVTAPKCTTYNYHHSPETPYCSCFDCNHLGHFAKDCRVTPRNVNPINARNPVARTCYECGAWELRKSGKRQGIHVRSKGDSPGPEHHDGKERVKPKRIRAMNMTLRSSIKDRILEAQKEAFDESARLQKGLDEMIKLRNDRAMYYLDRIWVPLKGDVRTLIMDEAHKSKYFVHPGVDKIYYDLRDRYWWPGMKKDIVVYVSEFLTCLKVNVEQQRHGVTISIISDRDSQFALRFWQSMQEALGTRLDMSTSYHSQTDVKFYYNNSYHSSVRCASFEDLYSRKCRSLIMLAEIREGVDKIYYDLRDRYWWPGMKKDIVVYVSEFLTCLKVNVEQQRSFGLLQQPEIPEWK
nr:putative reverse transcriptase domain-containing protein [Tanacetum cinerariifolium]